MRSKNYATKSSNFKTALTKLLTVGAFLFMTLSNIKSVKEKADIVKVISHFVDLKKDGSNYISICPFHNEKSKSFSVSAIKNIFKCFGCGVSGDVIDFVKLKKGVGYKEALDWISDFENLSLDTEYKPTEYVPLPISYIPNSIFKQSISYSKANNFTQFLDSILPGNNHDYYLSTSKNWPGAVCFWYIDIKGKIRSGKIMQYNSVTGKRIKEPKPLVTWVHRVLKIKYFNLSVCLFGEYLLNIYPNKPVGIVESEKTAIIASMVYPDKVWLASGSLTYLNYERCKVLTGRSVFLYPDSGAEDQWSKKALQLSELIPDTKFEVVPLTGFEKGYDLCDYILDHEL